MTIGEMMQCRQLSREDVDQAITHCEHQAMIRREMAAGEPEASLSAYFEGVGTGCQLAGNWLRIVMEEWERRRARIPAGDDLYEQRLLDGIADGFMGMLGITPGHKEE